MTGVGLGGYYIDTRVWWGNKKPTNWRGFLFGLNSNLILFSFETLFRFELRIIWID